MPLVRHDEAFVLEPMLCGGCRIVHAQFTDVAFPIEDEFAAVKVHSEIGRICLAHHAKRERRPAHEWSHAGRHHPVHGRPGDSNAVVDAGDHTALVRDQSVNQVFGHRQSGT